MEYETIKRPGLQGVIAADKHLVMWMGKLEHWRLPVLRWKRLPRMPLSRKWCACSGMIAHLRNRNSPNFSKAQQRKTVEKYAHSASKLADWLEGNLPEGLTFFL